MNYSRLPEHMQGAAKRYVEHGIPPGHFLTAVLENNFMEAFARADSKNTEAMKDWAGWIYNDAPLPCHGSPEKVRDWIEHGGLAGNVENTNDEQGERYPLSRGD